ncbi:MAG: histidine kinase N-terminal domain-containing protein [Acidimicrobiales bacterium]
MSPAGKSGPVPQDGQAHLQRLMAVWGMLADLSFSDLLLFVPQGDRAEGGSFLVAGQMRPTTGQTVHRDDLVGQVIDEAERPLVGRAWSLGQIVEGEVTVDGRGEPARAQCIPVRWKGEMLAVLTREAPIAVGGRRPGELERVYVETFDRVARMIMRGEFPNEVEDAPTAESPRVGDGLLLLDPTGRVAYASPNAVNALHRMGIYSNVAGLRLDEMGVEETAVQKAFFHGTPVTEEIERQPDVIVLLRCIPLLEPGAVTGALVLLRDVTDLRRRDRLLVSKDATIREVHHRVKNNLQTIGSLLRLQARRLPRGDGAWVALADAERRIRSIALVHEILSRDPSQQVPFSDIIGPLVRMAQEGVLAPERPVAFVVHGRAGEVPAELATPLAVVLTELLQNATEHAFPVAEGGPQDCRVEVLLHNDGDVLSVVVRDNGVGLPANFAIEATDTLGLSIVRDLVTGQLRGSLAMRNEAGTVVEISVPIAGRSRP